MAHPALADLEAGLDTIRAAPREAGIVELIVRRPAEGRRESLDVGELEPGRGLIGDVWTPGGRHGGDDQLTLMNSRVIELLAGDQQYVDLDLSEEALEAGTRLVVGESIVEVTSLPHTGCRKFAERFGQDGLRFVSSPVVRSLRLRGVYGRVVTAGVVRPGDAIRRRP